MVKVVHYKCACFYEDCLFFFILRESRKLSLSFPVGMQLNIWIGKFLSEYIGYIMHYRASMLNIF